MQVEKPPKSLSKHIKDVKKNFLIKAIVFWSNTCEVPQIPRFFIRYSIHLQTERELLNNNSYSYPLTLFRMNRQKSPPFSTQQFFPYNLYKSRSQPSKLSNFRFLMVLPHYFKIQSCIWYQSLVIELEHRLPLKKLVFVVKSVKYETRDVSLFNLMCAIACAHASTRATCLMPVKNSTLPFCL